MARKATQETASEQAAQTAPTITTEQAINRHRELHSIGTKLLRVALDLSELGAHGFSKSAQALAWKIAKTRPGEVE